MKLQIENVKVFVDLLDCLADFFSDVTLYLKDDWIAFKSMDPSNICMIEVKLFNVFFKEYTKGIDTDISFKLTDFNELMKLCLDEKVTLENSTDGGYLMITSKGKVDKKYKLPLIGQQQEYLDNDVALEKFTCKVKLDKDKFIYSIKALKPVSKDGGITFEVNDKKELYFKRQGDLKTGEVFFNKTDSEPGIAKYNYGFVTKFQTAIPICDELMLYYGTDVPMVLELKKTNSFILRYTLAPLVEDKD